MRILRLTLVFGLTVLLAGLAPAQGGEKSGVSHPASYYSPRYPGKPEEGDGLSDEAKQTLEELSRWAELPAYGSEGRPLPVTGSWNTDDWGPNHLVRMIQHGHHVLPTFGDPEFLGTADFTSFESEKVQNKLDEHYRPALEFAKKHNLPIVFRDWNWWSRFSTEKQWTELPPGESPFLIKNGEATETTSSWGPIERWRELGRHWMGHKLIKAIQRIYPDPPMVVFLNNNEGNRVRWAREIDASCTRFVEKYGEDLSDAEISRAIREGYIPRFQAFMKTARETFIQPAWKKNTLFVAYNNLWDTAYIGKGGRPEQGTWFEPGPNRGWLEWRQYQGGMPELYDNDWQPGKTDHTPWSPQTEAMNYHSTQDWIFEQDPDFYWASIVWDGGKVSDVWKGARRKVGKPYRYASRGQRYGFHRYGGMVQFCLWMARPRTLREFRGGANRGAYLNGTWLALVHAVDRPWENETLKEYWRFGEAVPNQNETHYFELEKEDPEWVRELDRWYLLTCDANPPREEWDGKTKLRVYSMALKLGEAPDRRWLIYAHAPLGAVADTAVELPGYGEVTLDSVPVGGSFFEVKEGEEDVTALLRGGPPEIDVRGSDRYVASGETVDFDAVVTSPAGQPFTHFTWSFGEGETVEQQNLSEVSRVLNEPGQHLVTVTGHVKNGGTVKGQAPVLVNRQPNEEMIYDLPLDGAYAWEGPWKGTGPQGRELVTYRHLPNHGRLPAPILADGRFVEDDERGTVLEVDGEHDGIWLALGRETVLHEQGHANKTISLRFRAKDVKQRQVLYAEGHGGFGFNIYIDRGKVYAGSWAPKGRDWGGHWLSADVEADTWHQVTLVLADATTEVRDGRLRLYLDGNRVAKGPGVRVPRHIAVPRVGRGRMEGKMLTRFHDGNDKEAKEQAGPFTGRLDDVRVGNTASPPGE